MLSRQKQEHDLTRISFGQIQRKIGEAAPKEQEAAQINKLCAMLNYRIIQDIWGIPEMFSSLFEKTLYETIAERISMGEKPVSTTQLCHAAQQVINLMIYVPDGGRYSNKVHCTSIDVKYLLWCAASHIRVVNTEDCVLMNSSQLLRHIYEVISQILCGTAYYDFCAISQNKRSPIEWTSETIIFHQEIFKYDLPASYISHDRNEKRDAISTETVTIEAVPLSVAEPHVCAFPSCSEKVWRDNLCWHHYQEENYLSK